MSEKMTTEDLSIYLTAREKRGCRSGLSGLENTNFYEVIFDRPGHLFDSIGREAFPYWKFPAARAFYDSLPDDVFKVIYYVPALNTGESVVEVVDHGTVHAEWFMTTSEMTTGNGTTTSKINELADAIYNEVSGADNREERRELTERIWNWLYGGMPEAQDCSIEELVAAWKEFDQPEENDVPPACPLAGWYR